MATAARSKRCDCDCDYDRCALAHCQLPRAWFFFFNSSRVLLLAMRMSSSYLTWCRTQLAAQLLISQQVLFSDPAVVVSGTGFAADKSAWFALSVAVWVNRITGEEIRHQRD